jgi:hypothetical protein
MRQAHHEQGENVPPLQAERRVQEGDVTKHTPGPWRATPYSVFSTRQDRRTETIVARCRLSVARTAEGLANAHLIAAAPDLLAACEEALEMAEYLSATWGTSHGDNYAEMAERLRAAIAKARGDD